MGVFGALVLRRIFIAGGAVLIQNFSWALCLFAALRRVVPMTGTFHGQRLLVRRNGFVMATPLVAVSVLIETTDVVVAVDSIPPFRVATAREDAELEPLWRPRRRSDRDRDRDREQRTRT